MNDRKAALEAIVAKKDDEFSLLNGRMTENVETPAFTVYYPTWRRVVTMR